MSEKVSESVTGQKQPKPTKEERDAAFSAGAGRKAEEHEKPSRRNEFEAPVGLELETKADNIDGH